MDALKAVIIDSFWSDFCISIHTELYLWVLKILGENSNILLIICSSIAYLGAYILNYFVGKILFVVFIYFANESQKINYDRIRISLMPYWALILIIALFLNLLKFAIVFFSMINLRFINIVLFSVLIRTLYNIYFF